MIFNKFDKIVFLGDSITWAAKLKETGEGAPANHPFGNGFVTLLNSYLTLHYPELELRLINKGVSGDRTVELLKRFESDVLELKPNWLVLMIGVNDAWRTLDTVQIKEFLEASSDYESNLKKLVLGAKEKDIKVIIMSPFIVSRDLADPLRKKLDFYNEICQKVSSTTNSLYINLQKAFDDLLKKITSYVLSNDRIHINFTGHMLITEELLKVIL